MKWLTNIVLLLSLAVPPVWGATTPPPAVNEFDTGAQSGQTVFTDKVAPYSGTKESVQNNLVVPVMSGGLLYSPDGKTSFKVNTLQSSDAPIMRVTSQPNLATADVKVIIIEQDLGHTGAYTSAVTFPPIGSAQMISTVCANGYIQCDPGTFSNCSYHLWSVATSGVMSSDVAGPNSATDTVGNVNSLSGCYCFNVACSKDHSAVLDIDTIASSVGGGVLATFLAANTGSIVTSANSQGLGVVTYYGVSPNNVIKGAKTASMTTAQIAAMPVTSSDDAETMQSYYSNPNGLATSADAAKQLQTNTPNSLFNVVSNAAQNQSGTKVSCVNLMTPSLGVKSRSIDQAGPGGNYCVDELSFAVLTQSGENTFALGIVGTGPSGIGSNGSHCSYPPFDAGLNYNAAPVDVVNFVQPATTIGYKITSVVGYLNVFGNGCSTGSASAYWSAEYAMHHPVIAQTSSNCGDPKQQQPLYTSKFTIYFDSQEIVTNDVKGCKAFEEDTVHCTIQEESWDDRPVVVHGTRRAFQQGQMCVDVPGPVRNAHVCTPSDRPWFRQDKIFTCTNLGSGYTFNDLPSRIKGIQDSTTMPTNSSMTYKDAGLTSTYGIPKDGETPVCSQVCKTKIATPKSVVVATGLPSTQTLTEKGVAGEAWSYFFKNCNGSGEGVWNCPVSSDKEIVVTQCGCNADMTDALKALSAADEATQDSICSK